MTTKICARCSGDLDVSMFRSSKGRIMSYCKPCESAYKREHYLKNADLVKAKAKKWREDNPERCAELNKSYYAANKEKQAEYARLYRLTHKDQENARKAAWAEANRGKVKAAEAKYRSQNKEACSNRISNWKRRNTDKLRVYAANRKSAKLQAVPAWYEEFDEFVVSEAAELAMLREDAIGVKWHIDHIVPLMSERVCGLHCAANVQVITESENVSKSNRYWPDGVAYAVAA